VKFESGGKAPFRRPCMQGHAKCSLHWTGMSEA